MTSLANESLARSRAVLAAMPAAPLGHFPTPIDVVDRFRRAAKIEPRVLIKRDDAITFGFGGNKVRKLRYVIPDLLSRRCDVVVTCGGVQSNHARATAAAAAVSGMACHIVVNGEPPQTPTGNALLNTMLGATFEYVSGREGRDPAMRRAEERLRSEGRHPAIVPLGASTPLGALGYAHAVSEVLSQIPTPDLIVHPCSSGGTSAGIVAGLVLNELDIPVIGISADDPPAAVLASVRSILDGMDSLLGTGGALAKGMNRLEVDDGFVGEGYGIPTSASREAQALAARSEAIFLDHTYTAKAMAGLLAGARSGRIPRDATVLFWHTGGQVALFA